jgi:hypothetical protein
MGAGLSRGIRGQTPRNCVRGSPWVLLQRGLLYYGAIEVRKELGPKLGIREVLITSTHNHQGPDTVGIWGMDPLHDGKYPRYLQFVDREIAKAITQAAIRETGPHETGAHRPAAFSFAGRSPNENR